MMNCSNTTAMEINDKELEAIEADRRCCYTCRHCVLDIDDVNYHCTKQGYMVVEKNIHKYNGCALWLPDAIAVKNKAQQ